MNLDQFIAKNEGKGLDYDGYYGNQCVDLILYYLRDVYGFASFGGNAKDWYINYGGALAQKFDRIANNPNDPNQLPKRGDVIIWDGSLPGSGGYGHIAIYLQSNGPGSFMSLDQNWGGQYVHKVNHNWGYVLGWLTPKASTPAPQPQGGDMIPDQDNYYWRWGKKAAMQIRGRELSRAEFSKFIAGQTGTRALEILSDDAEAERAQAAQDLGFLAQRDNWQGQIYGLQDQLKVVNAKINELNQTIVAIHEEEAREDITEAEKTENIKQLNDQIGVITGQLEEAHDKIKELESKPPANEQDVVQNFFKRIWNGLFKK